MNKNPDRLCLCTNGKYLKKIIFLGTFLEIKRKCYRIRYEGHIVALKNVSLLISLFFQKIIQHGFDFGGIV